MATRIMTAAVAILVAIVVLLFSDTIVLNITIAVISAIILRELFKAEKCTQYKVSYIICMIYVCAMPFMETAVLRPHLFLFTAVCVLAIFLTFLIQHKTLGFDKLSFMITTSALISLSLTSLIYIKNLDAKYGTFYLIITLSSAWLGDAGAYFVGVKFGKHKLCPEISPKKTVEGAVGGVVSSALLLNLIAVGYIAIIKGDISMINYPLITAIGIISAFLGMVGDLTASLIKRQCNIKDYGNIMPGHGGLLDRFDSVLFITPFMCIVLSHFSIFG